MKRQNRRSHPKDSINSLAVRSKKIGGFVEKIEKEKRKGEENKSDFPC